MFINKIILSIFLILFTVSSSHAFVFINEIFADPATGLTGDANHDGVRSASDDEFVELLNDSESSVDISGWQIKDTLQTRHVFLSNTVLLPYEYIVVFGGGNPNFDDIKWQKASTGGLNLNNTNESISLFNNALSVVDQVSYITLANNDQSIVRFPEKSSSNFILHSNAASNNTALYSPGTNISGEHFSQVVTTPEMPSYHYFMIALFGLALMKVSSNSFLWREENA